MANWIDNADSYICPVCGFECNNPNRFYGKCPKCGFIATKDIRSADVVDVVRCKDCVYYRKETFWCEINNGDGQTNCNWYEGDFCSYGERKYNDL